MGHAVCLSEATSPSQRAKLADARAGKLRERVPGYKRLLACSAAFLQHSYADLANSTPLDVPEAHKPVCSRHPMARLALWPTEMPDTRMPKLFPACLSLEASGLPGNSFCSTRRSVRYPTTGRADKAHAA